MGRILGMLQQQDLALAHLTACIRLGSAARPDPRSVRLVGDAGTSAAELVQALVARADLHLDASRPDAAAVDLRRALRFSATGGRNDRWDLRGRLAELDSGCTATQGELR